MIKNWLLIFIVSFRYGWKNKNDVHIATLAIHNVHVGFSFILQWNDKNQTSVLIILFQIIFMHNLRENIFEIKWNLNWSESAKINFPKSRRNYYSTPSCYRWKNPKCPNTGASYFFHFHLSSIIAVFMRFSSLIQTLPTSRCLQWRNARFCNVLLNITSCYWKSRCKMLRLGLPNGCYVTLRATSPCRRQRHKWLSVDVAPFESKESLFNPTRGTFWYFLPSVNSFFKRTRGAICLNLLI